MKLALYFTLTCNARCDHCITEAGPRVRRKMTLADARAVVAAIARTPQLDGIVFTGGESFLHRDELLELVRDCTAAGLKSEVVTNGFWATSRGAARAAIAPFRAAGLGMVRLSIDRFHLPYVAPERVHTALAALADEGYERHVTCVVDECTRVGGAPTVDDIVAADPAALASADEAYVAVLARELRRGWPPGLVELLRLYDFDSTACVLIDDAIAMRRQSAAGAAACAAHLAASMTLIQYQSLATEGRGRRLVGRVADQHVDDMPEMVCDSVIFMPTITPEGNVFPCCSSWVNHTHQAIGNVHESALADILTRVNGDPVALFMHYQGPAVLLKYLRARGGRPLAADVDGRRLLATVPPEGRRLPDRYSHPCHQCGTLLEAYTRAELEAAIRSYYEEHPWRLVVPVRGFDPAVIANVAPV